MNHLFVAKGVFITIAKLTQDRGDALKGLSALNFQKRIPSFFEKNYQKIPCFTDCCNIA